MDNKEILRGEKKTVGLSDEFLLEVLREEFKDSYAFLKGSINSQQNEELKKQLSSIDSQISDLTDYVKEKLYARGSHGYPMLDALPSADAKSSNRAELVEKYISIINEMWKMEEHCPQDARPVYEKVMHILEKECINLENYNSVESLSLPEFVYRSSDKVYSVDLDKTRHVGAAQSTRYILNLKSNDGKEEKGYFTKELNIDLQSKLDSELAREIENALFESTKADLITARDNLNSAPEYYGKFYAGIWVAEDMDIAILNAMKVLYGNTFKDKYVRSSLYSAFSRIIDNCDNTQNEIASACLALKNNDNIDKRNSAMSDIAILLGMEDIIAVSRDIIIMNPKGETQRGTFMEEAQGRSLDEVTGNEQYSSVFFDRLNDLQILDYICLNVDRHLDNMKYKLNDKMQLCGVCGFDNDSSFGNKTPLADEKWNKLPPLTTIKQISQRTADRISNLNSDSIRMILHRRGFSEGEISETVRRLDLLKNRVAELKLSNDIISSPDRYTFSSETKEEILTDSGKRPPINYIDRFVKYNKLAKRRELAGNPEEKTEFVYEADNDTFLDSLKMLDSFEKNLVDATSRIRGTSKNYENIRTQIKTAQEDIRKMLNSRTKEHRNFTPKEYAEYNSILTDVKKSAITYLKGKEEKHSDSKYEKKRINTVNAVVSSIDEFIVNHPYEQNVANAEMEVMEINKIAFRELEKIEKNKEMYGKFMDACDLIKKADFLAKHAYSCDLPFLAQINQEIPALINALKGQKTDIEKSLKNQKTVLKNEEETAENKQTAVQETEKLKKEKSEINGKLAILTAALNLSTIAKNGYEARDILQCNDEFLAGYREEVMKEADMADGRKSGKKDVKTLRTEYLAMRALEKKIELDKGSLRNTFHIMNKLSGEMKDPNYPVSIFTTAVKEQIYTYDVMRISDAEMRTLISEKSVSTERNMAKLLELSLSELSDSYSIDKYVDKKSMSKEAERKDLII